MVTGLVTHECSSLIIVPVSVLTFISWSIS